MYSRSSVGRERPVRLPENYSGCAFSKREIPEPSPRFLEVATPSVEDIAPKKEPLPPPSPATLPLPPPPPKSEGHLPLSLSQFRGGLEFDQLLILGLIFLLGDHPEESDIVTTLLLLLLCA